MSSTDQYGSRRRPLAAALLFAVTFMVGISILSPPDFNASDATWIAFSDDRSHRIAALVATYLLLVAGGAFVWFAAELARRVGSRVVYASGWAVAGLLWVSVVLNYAVPLSKIDPGFAGAPPAGAELERLTTFMGAVALGIFAAPVAAFLIVAACVAGRRTGALARWVCWAGFPLAAILAVLGGAMFPLPLIPLWVLLAGASLSFRRERSPDALPAAA